MNYRALCSAFTREVGIGGGREVQSVTGQSGEIARVVNWIAQASVDIESLYADWKFLWKSNTFNTVPGTAIQDKPSDYHQYDRDKAQIDSVRGVRVIEHELWDGYDDGATGQPHTVVILPDGNIQLYPTPDDAYTVTLPYYRAPKALSADTDTPLIPETYHDLIWMRAVLKYGYYEAAPEMLQRVQSEYPQRLAALEANQLPGRHRYGLAQDPDPLVVVPE